MLRDSKSYETQLIDAVRSVNRALGGTYGTSSAIYKNEYNQFEVQLIDAIKGIGRTLSGNGISIKGGLGGGEVSAAEFQDLSRRVTKLESESFFRLVDGNVTLKEQYQNLWVPGWLAAGGIGSGSGGGGVVEHLYDIGDVTITNVTDGQGIVWDATNGVWKNATIGGGGSGMVTAVRMNGINYSPSPTGVVDIGTVLTSFTETDPTVPSWAKQTNPSFYIGTTQVQTSSAGQALTGILSVKASSATSSLMEWDSTNNAWHFYGNMYADGWVAAGGVGSGGGTGGSVVTISNLLSSGTRIATITIDGTDYNILAPSGGGSGSVTSVAMTVPTGLSVSGSPITSSGTLAVSLASGYVIPQQSTLDNFVTLDGTQTITGAKTFTAPVSVDPSGNASSYIDIGNARLVYDAGTNALHITKKSGSATVGLFADGFVAAGGVAGQTTASYVDLESAQTIGGNKTFSGTTQLGQTMIGTISILGSGTAPYINNILDRIYIQRAGQTGVSMCATAGQVVIGALNTTNTSKLFVNGNAAFTYATGSTISISEIVSRIEALENA